MTRQISNQERNLLVALMREKILPHLLLPARVLSHPFVDAPLENLLVMTVFRSASVAGELDSGLKFIAALVLHEGITIQRHLSIWIIALPFGEMALLGDRFDDP